MEITLNLTEEELETLLTSLAADIVQMTKDVKTAEKYPDSQHWKKVKARCEAKVERAEALMLKAMRARTLAEENNQ